METFSPGGRLWLIRAVANKELRPSRHYAEILYSCTMCGNCREHCCLEFGEEILNMMTAARAELVNQSILPLNVQKYFENIYSFNNPWKKSKKKRGDWAAGTGTHLYESCDQYLYYAGDVASFHPRASQVSRTICQLLSQAEVSFGILGKEEVPDGNDVKDMGERDLFEYLMDKNIEIFKKNGVKKIITYSPHAYNTMKNHYKKMADSTVVFHYLDIMQTILSERRFDSSEKSTVKVTYHDSCFLGRWNKKYDLPRDILAQIPFIELVEMERSRENAFCCGGGNGNFFTDTIGGNKDSPSRIRVREALSSGAEIIAVSCPICLIMLEDAILSEKVETQISVLDIAEILQAAINGN